MQSHFLTLFRFSAWRFGKLIDFVQKNRKIQDLWYRDEGLFFGSVHATLSHIILTDNLWYMRINKLAELNSPFDQEQYRELTKITVTEQKIRDLFKLQDSDWDAWSEALNKESTRAELLPRLIDQQEAWLRTIINYNEDDFNQILEYVDTNGIQTKRQIHTAFTHIINHQTHHIGQLSSVFTRHYDKQSFPALNFSDFPAAKS